MPYDFLISGVNLYLYATSVRLSQGCGDVGRSSRKREEKISRDSYTNSRGGFAGGGPKARTTKCGTLVKMGFRGANRGTPLGDAKTGVSDVCTYSVSSGYLERTPACGEQMDGAKI